VPIKNFYSFGNLKQFNSENMKKIYSFLAAAALSISSIGLQAQNYDLGVSSILNLADNSDVIPGFSITSVQFSIRNYGTTNLTASGASSVRVRIIFNGTDSTQYNMPNGFLLNAGDSAILNLPPIDLSTRLTSGSNTICIKTVVEAPATDTDPANDQRCITVNFNAGNVPDISATTIAITNPSNPNNRFALGTIINEMQATFTNNSTITIPAGNRINYTVTVAGVPLDLVGTLQTNLTPNGTTTRTITNGGTITLPSIPQIVGIYKVCAYSRVGDNNPANDTVCIDVEMFDPTANVVTLATANKIKAFYNQEQVVVDLTLDNATDVQVILHNVAGQQIAQKNTRVFGGAEERVVMPTQNLSAGVYVVSVLTEGQMVGSTKLVVR
jgi:hypothetical protein